MRLIDADDLIKMLEDGVWNDVVQVVREQPTAYDVDKVIEHLKENVENIEDEEGTHHFVIDSFTAEYLVKAGGIHE